MRDLAYDLADNAAKIKYEHLPKDVVEVTKKFILDTLATIMAGSSAPGCKGVVDLIKEWGGKEESTILIYGGKVISENAALVNSMMAHARDFDDTHDVAVLHANASVLPAALAAAERMGGITGRDLIAAVATGVDLMCRLGLGIMGQLSWHFSATTGYFGATVAAGKIMNLDESEILRALGIAYSQCAGNVQTIVDGGLTKRMQPAFAARASILSSILAQRGITAARNIFEGQYGFFPLYHGGKYNREKITQNLGAEFEGKNLSVKLYPCCRYTHAGIDATLNIIQENDIKPHDVTEVVAHVTRAAYDVVGKPFAIRESPQVDAQFSLPYTIAVAMVRRDVFIDDFLEEKIKGDTRVLQLAQKVRVVVDQEPIGKGLTPCVVGIKTKNGKLYSERVEILRGDPRKPVSIEKVAEKFRKCADFSAKPLPQENLAEVISLVSHLETIPNVSELVKVVA